METCSPALPISLSIMVTGLPSALGNVTLPFEQGKSVTPGCLRGNEAEKPSKESSSGEKEVFFVSNLQNGF